MPQPHFQQQNLAQLLMQYPHFCQQQPGSGAPAEFDFDTQQLTQQLPSVGSNLSLSSSSSVCFHETSLADQLEFPLMNSPRGANMGLSSDAYGLSPIAPTDFTPQMSIVKSELGPMSTGEYCPLETFVAAQPGYSRTPMHRTSPSPFYGRAASALTSHAESKVINSLSRSIAFAFCLCLLPMPSAFAFCLCLLPSAFCLLPLPPNAVHMPSQGALLAHVWCNALLHLLQPCSVAVVIYWVAVFCDSHMLFAVCFVLLIPCSQ